MTGISPHTACLGLILCVATIVRTWGIDFGLPHLNARPDETGITIIALNFFSGDLNPHFFRYPSFYFYALAPFFGIYAGLRLLTGASRGDLLTEIAFDPSVYVLISRGLSATFGIATVFLLYCLAGRVADRRTALIASFLLATCYLHVRESHFGLLDVTMTFWIVLATYFLIRILDDTTSHRWYWMAGLASGIAASTKYAGVFLAAGLVIAWGSRQPRDAIFSVFFKSKQIRLYVGSAVGGFLLFTPFALLDFGTFLSDVRAEALHLREGHAGITDQIGLIYHLRYSLLHGVGFPLLIVACSGAIDLFRSNRPLALTILAFPVVFYLTAGAGRTIFVRYVIPLTPFLCLLAAIGITSAVARFSPRVTLYASLAAMLVAWPSMHKVYGMDVLLSRTDSRVLAADWIAGHLPEGSRIFQSGTDWAHVEAKPSRQTLESRIQRARAEGKKGGRLQIRLDNTRPGAGYHLTTLDPEKPIWQTDDRPDYAILHESPLLAYTPVTSDLREWLDANYTPIHTIDGVGPGQPEWYDQIDAQILPFSDFTHAERPGPDITIHKRRDLD